MSEVTNHPHNQTADFDYDKAVAAFTAPESVVEGVTVGKVLKDNAPHVVCLLYTSDAADE